MWSRMTSTRVLLVATLATVLGCGNRSGSVGSGAAEGRSRATTAPAGPSAAEVTGRFTIHEWGLVGMVAGTNWGAAASGVSTNAPAAGLGFGSLGRGGKPVIYVHLDEGTNEARLDVSLGLPPAAVVEAFPATSARGSAAWTGVHATRGACTSPTPAPTAESQACRSTVDGFCEAAEIPRYEADRDVCLEVGEARVHSIFYRAGVLDTSALPLVLDLGVPPTVRRSGDARIEGPVLYLEKGEGGAPAIHALAADVASGASPSGAEDTITVAETRTRLVAEAKRRGLTEDEAEAFVDAWSPAFFDTCRRTGPEASGDPPVAFAPADHSLLYFAPEALVDAMIPLETRPRARARHRVFLVRIVGAAAMGHGGGGFYSTESAPRGAPRPTVRMVEAEVRGSLSPEVIRRIARRNLPQIAHCYEMGLRGRPEFQGRVVVGAVIGTDGSVVSADIRSSSIFDGNVESCIRAAVQRWQFPAPENGTVVWNQPFLLISANQ